MHDQSMANASDFFLAAECTDQDEPCWNVFCSLKFPASQQLFSLRPVILSMMLSEADCCLGTAAGACCTEALEEWIQPGQRRTEELPGSIQCPVS